MVNGSVNALHIALAAAVVGWLVFSLSHSVAVWRKRNSNEASERRLGLLYAALMVCCISLVGAWFNRELTRRAGTIAGTDFFVVRAHAGATAHLTDANAVHDGMPLVTYQTPQAEREVLRLRGEISVLEEQIKVKLLQPVALSPELLRKSQQETDTQRARMTQLGFGSLRLPGASEDDLLEAQRAKSRLANLQLQRTASLVQDGVLARQKLDTDSAAAHEAAQELREREQLIAAAKTGDAAAESLQASIGRDQERAHSERAAEVAELKAQREELRNDLMALQAEQVIDAPFNGSVVYRNPSPALSGEGQVILALAKGAGFIATMQVPAREAAMLQPGRSLTMKLEHSLVSEEVSGRLLSTRAAAGAADRADLLIECNLPTEQFASFPSGGVPVSLEWRPSMLSDRFAQAGLALAGALVALWLFIQVRITFCRYLGLPHPETIEIDRVLAQLDSTIENVGAGR